MQRTMLKSKLHGAIVTEARLDYEGSIAIDAELLDAADILPNEQVHVYNVTNGERFITYAIRARRGSGTISLNGAAARLGSPGDQLIIATYAHVDDTEAARLRPRIVYVDEKNRLRR